jgi:hypothetical protein
MSDSYDKNCLRRIANFTTVKNQFKFDNKEFSANKASLRQQLKTYSPKLQALMEKIRDLDEADAKRGKLFKHFIFSDVPFQGAGAKVTASVFEAHGYNLVYDKRQNMLSKEDLLKSKGNNFALLCQTPVFGKPLPISKPTKGKMAIINMFNERPDNIHGDVCRFIILDRGFKEGIDLFDVKYVHVLEPQTSQADLRQAIGRATRHCGQEGLEFDAKKGWELMVYVYDSLLPEPTQKQSGCMTLFELYQKAAKIDMRELVFAADLEQLSIQGSVDFKFNRPIHTFNMSGGDAPRLVWKPARPRKPLLHPHSKSQKPFKPSLSPIPQATPNPLPQVKSVKRNFKPSLPPISQSTANPFKREKQLKQKFKPSLPPISQDVPNPFATLIKGKRQWAPSLSPIAQSNDENTSAQTKIDVAIPVQNDAQEDFHEKMIPSLKGKLSFVSVRDYVDKHFDQFAWPPLKLQNECTKKGGQSTANMPTLSQFLPSQNFVRHFFTPNQPMKGMLFWHSVGTGKTCAAIATASTTFAREGYKIIWATRRTLRGDMWKDMFINVCDSELRERILKRQVTMLPLKDKRDLKKQSVMKTVMQLVPKAWSIRPISYKQLENAITNNNEVGYTLRERNPGDPLKKTLIIVDEAHKLFGGEDLSSAERPDPEIIIKGIQNSYKVSGKDSVRVLLLTGTPFTNDPMQLIKLLNMLKPDGRMPETFDGFSKIYLDNEGRFTSKGKFRFLDDIAGLISYLNRERDARQFAQVNMVPIMVRMSGSVVDPEDIEQKRKLLESSKETLDMKIEAYKDKYNDMVVDVKHKRATDCHKLPKADLLDCRKRYDRNVLAIKDEYKRKVQEVKEDMATVKNKMKALKPPTKKDDFSQLGFLHNQCKLKIKKAK